MATITIDGVAHSARAGTKVSALQRTNPALPFACLAGRCGTCLVHVTTGNFGPMGERERQFLTARGLSLAGDMRLLCQAMVIGSATVESKATKASAAST
jgi:ferredoxin